MAEYLVFIDESGDPNLEKIDPQYPALGVVAIIFEKEYFENEVLLNFRTLKKSHGFQENDIFHSRDIRKHEGIFSVLTHHEKRSIFYEAINTFLGKNHFKIIASVVKKRELTAQYYYPSCPYNLSFQFILERLEHFLRLNGGKAHIFVEKRGGQETALENVFQRIKTEGNDFIESTNFQSVFPQKTLSFVGKENEGGQLADLCAYPITTKILRPQKENIPFQILFPKLYAGGFGEVQKYGLKIFP